MDTDSLSMEEKINCIFISVQKIESAFGAQQAKIEKLESTVEVLSNEVLTLKNLVNFREQELHSCSSRISGFQLTEEDKTSGSKYLGERLYDRVLRLIITAAKANVPTLPNTILSCYRVGSTAAKPNQPNSPPVVVKLSNTTLKVAIMKSKKDSTLGPTDAEKAAGFRKVLIFEDLTPPAFKKLKEMQEREEISKAWSIDGRLFFILQGSLNKYNSYSILSRPHFKTLITSSKRMQLLILHFVKPFHKKM